LCAWEEGVQPVIKDREILIDPDIGRIVVGVKNQDEVNALQSHLLLTYTYGAVGGSGHVGAHPTSRPRVVMESNSTPVVKEVNLRASPPVSLKDALEAVHAANPPDVIEIRDSIVHDLDIASIAGVVTEDGGPNLCLKKPLTVRAVSDERPIIRLKNHPLRFRPHDAANAAGITVRFEGLYITRDESSLSASQPLIARAALNKLEIINCTLDPGGHRNLDGSRSESLRSMEIRESYGFADSAPADAFDQTPEIILENTIAGPLLIDFGYTLSFANCVIDAGKGVGDSAGDSFAVTGGTDPIDGWGPPTEVRGITVFGRMRVESICGRGGIWVHPLEVLNNQKGCIRHSYLSAGANRLPQNLGCLTGNEARLAFVSEAFGDPAYGQLAHSADFRIRERGPNDDAMGAFGFLLEAHKWRNIQIRFREFMPIGVRPLLIPVT